MRTAMFVLGALMVTCAAIGWCCMHVSDAWEDEEEYD